MTFGAALEILRAGGRVCRASRPQRVLRLARPTALGDLTEVIFLAEEGASCAPVLIPARDALATDWQEVLR